MFAAPQMQPAPTGHRHTRSSSNTLANAQFYNPHAQPVTRPQRYPAQRAHTVPHSLHHAPQYVHQPQYSTHSMHRRQRTAPPQFSDTDPNAVETDEHRLSQRQKQIDIGKNTVGYAAYTQTVPKVQRDIKRRYIDQPVTPDKYVVCSKRAFDGIVKKWRKLLHQYEPHVDAAAQHSAALSGTVQQQAQQYTVQYTAAEPNINITPLLNKRVNTLKHTIPEMTPILRLTETVTTHKRKSSSNDSNLYNTSATTFKGSVKSVRVTPSQSPNSLLNGSLQFDVDVQSYINELLDCSYTDVPADTSFELGNVSAAGIVVQESPISTKRVKR